MKQRESYFGVKFSLPLSSSLVKVLSVFFLLRWDDRLQCFSPLAPVIIREANIDTFAAFSETFAVNVFR